MPEYTVVFTKKGSIAKKGETEVVFAPSAEDARQMARQTLPKSAKIIDVIRSHDYTSNSSYYTSA